MVAVILILVIGGVVMLVFAYLKAIHEFNSHALDRYGYRPVTWGRAGYMVLPYLTLLLGIWLSLVTQDSTNFVIAVVAAGLLTFALTWRIKKRISMPMALLATFLLAVAGAMLTALGLLACLILFRRRDDSRLAGQRR